MSNWILRNLKESNGFVAKRVRPLTRMVAIITYGTIICLDGRIITPEMYYKVNMEE